MTTGALIFMLLSWFFVLGLTGWAFGRILRHPRHLDPDGTGPASPPEPGRFDASGRPLDRP